MKVTKDAQGATDASQTEANDNLINGALKATAERQDAYAARMLALVTTIPNDLKNTAYEPVIDISLAVPKSKTPGVTRKEQAVFTTFTMKKLWAAISGKGFGKSKEALAAFQDGRPVSVGYRIYTKGETYPATRDIVNGAGKVVIPKGTLLKYENDGLEFILASAASFQSLDQVTDSKIKIKLATSSVKLASIADDDED